MVRKTGFACLLALAPLTSIAADKHQAISSSFQICIGSPSQYKFTFEVGIDGIRGTIRRRGRALNYEISRHPGPDKFEADDRQWYAVGAKELPPTLSLVAEYPGPAFGAERLYGFTADDFYIRGARITDRIYIKLSANTKQDASSLLPKVGAALYRCTKGSHPIQQGIP
ncbi:hypothetical protein [Rhodanobacter sp. L36]|uniref:hypothetical protein n=1 Tax=Rhodanobacter sp. L36 TaxID=1747221 RepID=UPI00131CD5B7|nr:hypothetical protein [Rhodanobacter sp. L36]